MLRNLKYLLITTSLFFGCTSNVTFPCNTDVRLKPTDEMRMNGDGIAAMYSAVHMWNPVGAKFKLPEELPPNAYVLELPISLAKLEDTVAGIYYSDGRIVIDRDSWLAANREFRLMRNVVAHEIGHSMGLQHVKDPNSLMFWNANDNVNMLSLTDIEEFNRVCR